TCRGRTGTGSTAGPADRLQAVGGAIVALDSGLGHMSERLTTHSFRHSAVTFALLGGASLQQAQALARHTNLTTTMVYAHNVDRVSQAPERFVDGLLDD
ncbi:tyrosine-type recombinase/integrase, partial [Collinsella sp. HCP28S3_B9]|uniref:tyrosine-type recombinase/integrase n=1 Tax=Collinsella sp. HCP28S3_B9 TaxID=3438920 RepID=UPI003F89BCF0